MNFQNNIIYITHIYQLTYWYYIGWPTHCLPNQQYLCPTLTGPIKKKFSESNQIYIMYTRSLEYTTSKIWGTFVLVTWRWRVSNMLSNEYDGKKKVSEWAQIFIMIILRASCYKNSIETFLSLLDGYIGIWVGIRLLTHGRPGSIEACPRAPLCTIGRYYSVGIVYQMGVHWLSMKRSGTRNTLRKNALPSRIAIDLSPSHGIGFWRDKFGSYSGQA